MAVGLVQTRIRGNLGEDPELKEVGGGTKLVEVAIAATVNRYDSSEGGYVERTIWRDVTVFGRDAEYLAQYGSKGDLIELTAEETDEKYEDNDGITRYVTNYKYDMGDLVLLDTGGGGASPEEQLDRGKATDSGGSDSNPDDDLPF